MSKTQKNSKISRSAIIECREQILQWYDNNKRTLPWRDINDPYKTWLSEIMLQQTTVTAVKPYYHKFLEKWPTIFDLASATQDEVMHEWAGLGYYSRARNLHKCAVTIANDYDGKFPQDQKQLLKLPGIGDYTSAAIMTIAFGLPATVIDGNIERIISRLFTIKDPLPKSKPIYKTHTAKFFDNFTDRPGDLAQAFMDIGSGICTPKNPKCIICPLAEHCKAHKAGEQEAYPIKIKKKKRPYKYGHAYLIQNTNGEILLERRPDTGLLASTLGFPTSDWDIDLKEHYNYLKNIKNTDLKIQHTFTHFDLELSLHTAEIDHRPNNAVWTKPHSKNTKGLPSLFKKVYNQFLKIL